MMTLSATLAVRKNCPYRKEVDYGTLTVEFPVEVDEDGPELHALAVTLRGLDYEEISHEAFTREVQRKTGASRVTTRWNTAGMEVVCDLPVGS